MKTKLHFLLIAVLFSFSSVFAAKPTGTAKSTAVAYPIISLTGSGVGGWGVDLDLQTSNGVVYTLNNFEIVSGEVKFRLNHRWHDQSPDLEYPAPVPGVDQDDWGYDKASTVVPIGFPADIGTSNVATPAAAIGNIPSTPGFWNVTFNLTTKAYSFTPGVNPNRAVVINGGGLAADAVLSSKDGVNYSKESVVFTTGGSAKFLEVASPINPTPTANWSSALFPGGKGTQDGALIPVAPGVYYVFFNISDTDFDPLVDNSGTYSFDPTTVSMIGAMNGWNDGSGTWDMLTDDNVTFYLNGVTLASGGDFKFRDNHSWNNNFGASAVAGIAAPDCCEVSNIPYNAGKYNVTFNRLTLEYKFISLDANITFTSAKVAASPVNLGTSDGTNYVAQHVIFDAGVGTGNFNEIVSVLNPGPTFGSWPVTATPDGALTPDGARNVAFNKTTGVYSFPYVTYGISGGMNGWGSNDDNLTTTDGITYTLANYVIAGTTPQEFKIRENRSWSFKNFGDTASPAGVSGTAVHEGTNFKLAPGTYNITFNRSTLAFSFTNALAVNKFETNKFSVYPNPTNNSWNFTSANSEISSLRIVDMLGKTVLSKKASSKEVSVDASSLSKGMYFAEIVSGDAVQTVKVMKN